MKVRDVLKRAIPTIEDKILRVAAAADIEEGGGGERTEGGAKIGAEAIAAAEDLEEEA
jgi:hypothetical protein